MKHDEKKQWDEAWQTDLAEAITDLDELCRRLELPGESVRDGQSAAESYPIFVPKSFLDRMERGNPKDPLLLQILPQRRELEQVDGFSDDPVGERCSDSFISHSASSIHSLPKCAGNFSLMQKYSGRALILTSEQCGVHCRFCFRRHVSKSGHPKDFQKIIDPIRADSSIREIILSGGDPLMLTDEELDRLFHYIAEIPHVKRIRLHSRVPIVLPSRISTGFIEILGSFSPIFLVLHVNHPNELNEEVLVRLRKLSGIAILSQTVLLKEVNDDVEILFRLFETLVDNGIVPYYLHQLDKVAGAAHFEVSPEKGKKIVEQLHNLLPGYGVPRYVREIAGAPAKVLIQ